MKCPHSITILIFDEVSGGTEAIYNKGIAGSSNNSVYDALYFRMIQQMLAVIQHNVTALGVIILRSRA